MAENKFPYIYDAVMAGEKKKNRRMVKSGCIARRKMVVNCLPGWYAKRSEIPARELSSNTRFLETRIEIDQGLGELETSDQGKGGCANNIALVSTSCRGSAGQGLNVCSHTIVNRQGRDCGSKLSKPYN
jgi:hypothetical protein